MIARRIIHAVTAWWLARRVERRAPELAALRKAEAERRRKHRPVKDIHLTRRAIVHRRLADELGRAS
jgi:hypothetical protein